MLSALSFTQHSFFNGPLCAYDSPSSFLPSLEAMPSAMQRKPLHSTPTPTPQPVEDRPFVVSPGNMFRVYNYTPQEGAAGTSIVVSVHFAFESAQTTFLRIVVGSRALSTTVRASSSGRDGEWDLEATVPEYEIACAGAYPPSAVPLTVQALDGSNTTLDSVTFGKFSYTPRGVPSLLPCKRAASDDLKLGSSSAPGTPDHKPSANLPSSSHSLVSRKTSRPTTSGGPARARITNRPASPKESQLARGPLKKQSLIRARRSGSEDDDAESSYRAALSIQTPTEAMADMSTWDEDERVVGRRLVRFTRVQEGCTLHVVCEAISPSEYVDGDAVVSCIARPSEYSGDSSASQCCITSVDIIFLLECLVGDIFNIEEKNRIRRNLEGFRPKTVSKNKVGTEEFFQKIMDFPAPKPRNIEKDVKVFDWAVLHQALEKIISKYTLRPTTKKHEGSATPPVLESLGMSPHLSSMIKPYSASSSPAPETTTDPSYMFPQTSYPSQYPSLENTYTTVGALAPPNPYDSFLNPLSSTPSPTPTFATPSTSPSASSALSLAYSAADSYLDQAQSLYQPAYPDHSTYGATDVYGQSYDALDYRMKMSPPTEFQGPHAYL